jgi:hypothetical protein
LGPNGVAGPSDEGTRRSTRGALLVRLVDFEFPVLYIQSGALQGVTVHLGPAEFVHCDDSWVVVDCPGLTLSYIGLVPF